MAIKKDFTITVSYINEQDIADVITKEKVIPAAYVRVVNTAGTKTAITATVEILATSTDLTPIQVRYYTFTPNLAVDSDNFIAQAYNHLKTLQEFAGGEDC